MSEIICPACVGSGREGHGENCGTCRGTGRYTPAASELSSRSAPAGTPDTTITDLVRRIEQVTALNRQDGSCVVPRDLLMAVRARLLWESSAPAGTQDTARMDTLESCSQIEAHVFSGTQNVRGYAEDVDVQNWHVVYDGVAYWGETLRDAIDAAIADAKPAGRVASSVVPGSPPPEGRE